MKTMRMWLCLLFLCLVFLLNCRSVYAAPVNQDKWVIDQNLTLAAKNTARFALFFDWSMQNYNWACVAKSPDKSCDNSNNPLYKLWSENVSYIVIPLILLSIIVSAVMLVLPHGKGYGVARLIPNFLLIFIFVFLSYSIIQLVYQFADVLQQGLLKTHGNTCPPSCLSQADLIWVGWDYNTIVGLRVDNPNYNESALISSILTEATGITYFVISVILMMRKLVLWFFLVVSPIIPLLFLFPYTRNIGKLWITSLAKWVVYAPLFAVFLRSAAFLRGNMPISFANPDIGNPAKILYPTAINLLMGMGAQKPSATNSLNLTETFAEYLFYILMMWVVIVLPWLLLRYKLQVRENSTLMRYLISLQTTLRTKYNETVMNNLTKPPHQQGGLSAMPFMKRPAPSVTNTTSDANT